MRLDFLKYRWEGDALHISARRIGEGPEVTPEALVGRPPKRLVFENISDVFHKEKEYITKLLWPVVREQEGEVVEDDV